VTPYEAITALGNEALVGAAIILGHREMLLVQIGLERVGKSQRRTAFLDYVGNTHFA
jgi:hypothetical protein